MFIFYKTNNVFVDYFLILVQDDTHVSISCRHISWEIPLRVVKISNSKTDIDHARNVTPIHSPLHGTVLYLHASDIAIYV